MNYLKSGEYTIYRKPLWYHEKGLMQTATGYGRKLSTEYMVKLNNREYRVYCAISSNSGTCYIVKKGQWFILSDFPE